MRRVLTALLALSACHSAFAADIVGAWDLKGSVFFNAVETTCLIRAAVIGLRGDL